MMEEYYIEAEITLKTKVYIEAKNVEEAKLEAKKTFIDELKLNVSRNSCYEGGDFDIFIEEVIKCE